MRRCYHPIMRRPRAIAVVLALAGLPALAVVLASAGVPTPVGAAVVPASQSPASQPPAALPPAQQAPSPPAAETPDAAAPDAEDVQDVGADRFPPVGEIVKRMLARAKRQDERGAELRYESRITAATRTLDEDGEVTKTETTVHRRYPVEGELFEELIERDGRPLDADERREQGERRDAFARGARERAREGGGRAETNDERQVRLGPELIERYQASVVGLETVRGEPCWVVAFAPRAGKLPERTRIDKALNRSSGTMYVARADHGLARVDFRMDEPVRYLWGIATLRRAEGSLEFERVEPDVWLPKRYDFRMELRVLFRTRRQQVVREWVERRHLE